MLLPVLASALFAAQSQTDVVPSDPPREAIFGEAPVFQESALDDSLPLPTPAVWREGAQGDELVAAASGDPFFLGFVAGKYYPPADERIDPALAALVAALPDDGRPAREAFAFVMFSKRMTQARIATLEALGLRVLDFHPFQCLKVALPASALESVAGLDFVRWVGLAKPWQKLHPDLAAVPASATAIDLIVSVFDSDLCEASSSRPIGSVQFADPAGTIEAGSADALPRTWMSNGWQQRELERLGAEIRSYSPRMRTFRVRLAPAALEGLVALDFVQFVELEKENLLAHDESMPMVHADRVRASYDGGTNSAAITGVIDSGCDIGHAALDPYIVGWDMTTENLGPFEDFDGHGSHVWGTVLGNGDVEDSFQGAAPGLGWAQNGRVFSVKIFNTAGSSAGVDYSAVLSAMHTSFNDGTFVTPRPMVVNNSYGLGASFPTGTEASARTIDAEVWDYDQLYVFATGNEGPGAGTLREQSSAKNALSVGSVRDFAISGTYPGEIHDSSSRGPCGDGRWKPNVCAPGRQIHSIEAETTTGYVDKSGTSMATPHVVGVASQLLDHYSFLRYNPEALSAVLMASAITKNDQTLAGPSGASLTHFNAYGTGRVDSYKANYGDSQQALYFWSATLGPSGSTYVEFPVNAGATRLSVVVHYKEVEASAGASQALRNDFDSFLDASPFSAGNNSGDYTAQQSSVDNTEIRILNSPTATDWRVKIAPVATVPTDTVRVGICAVVTYGDTTPTPSFNLSVNDSYVQPGDDVQVFASYQNPSYVASAVFLDSSSVGDTLTGSSGVMADGSTTDWMANQHSGRDVEVGNVIHGTSRTALWTTHWNTEGLKNFSVTARSDNAVDASDSINVYVDGSAPSLPLNLHSTSHTLNAWSNDDSLDFAWTSATDLLSGVDGYGVSWGGAPGVFVANTKDIEQSPSTYTQTVSEGAARYFAMKTVDNSGNWNAGTAEVGPYKIDLTAPSAASALHSPTHTLGVPSCSTNVTVLWTAATDALSGVAGYVGVWTTSPLTIPIGATNIVGNATSFAADIGSSTSARYFHLRPVDQAGNSGTTAHFGPIYANSSAVLIYCTGKTNSLGCVPAVGTNGAQPSKSAGNFTVTCSQALNNKFGLMFWGTAASAAPFQGGIKCAASPTVRGPNASSGGSAAGNDCSGTYAFTFSTAYMSTFGIDPGDTLYCQFWMRDPASASTTGLSNALQFTVCQ